MFEAPPGQYAFRTSLDMRHVSGRIVLVQGNRFAVRVQGGGTRLFELAGRALLAGGNLHDLLGNGASVTVRYSDNAGARTALAHHVQRHG